MIHAHVIDMLFNDIEAFKDLYWNVNITRPNIAHVWIEEGMVCIEVYDGKKAHIIGILTHDDTDLIFGQIDTMLEEHIE